MQEAVEPLVESLLAQRVYTQLGQRFVQVGEQSVPYHADFKLFLTTRVARPR